MKTVQARTIEPIVVCDTELGSRAATI